MGGMKNITNVIHPRSHLQRPRLVRTALLPPPLVRPRLAASVHFAGQTRTNRCSGSTANLDDERFRFCWMSGFRQRSPQIMLHEYQLNRAIARLVRVWKWCRLRDGFAEDAALRLSGRGKQIDLGGSCSALLAVGSDAPAACDRGGWLWRHLGQRLC